MFPTVLCSLSPDCHVVGASFCIQLLLCFLVQMRYQDLVMGSLRLLDCGTVGVMLRAVGLLPRSRKPLVVLLCSLVGMWHQFLADVLARSLSLDYRAVGVTLRIVGLWLLLLLCSVPLVGMSNRVMVSPRPLDCTVVGVSCHILLVVPLLGDPLLSVSLLAVPLLADPLLAVPLLLAHRVVAVLFWVLFVCKVVGVSRWLSRRPLELCRN